MKRLLGKNIYFVITGAPKASYAKWIIKELISEGANVYTIPTQAGQDFVRVEDLKDIKGNTVKTDWDESISLPKEDIVLIAPCTFNTLNSIACGLANTYPLCLVASAIGHSSPVFIAPAMNKGLWEHACIQENIKKLESWNCRVIWPIISGAKTTMADYGKILDTIYFSNQRVNYIPVRQQSKLLLNKLNIYREKYFDLFKEIGDFLLEEGMNLPTAGCLSIKVPEGFLITSTGCDISNLELENLVLVPDFNEKKNEIHWTGKNLPSSETPLHCIIHKYRGDPIILHFHCPKITYSSKMSRYRSRRYIRYGNFKIGYSSLANLEKFNFFIMKHHGEVAAAKDTNQLKSLITKIFKQS